MRLSGGLIATVLAAGLLPTVALPAAAEGDVTDLVINEYYARGGSANQPFTHKFVELYNTGDEEVSLDGLSLQYRSANGPGSANRTALSGVVEADGYFLIQLNSNGSTGEPLPTPDHVATNVTPGGQNGVIFLAATTDAVSVPAGDVLDSDVADLIIDLVGTGTANAFEGGAAAANVGGNSDPLSWQRTDYVDTDDNAADFTMDTPSPTNSAGEGGAPEPPRELDAEIAELRGAGEQDPALGDIITTRGVVTANYVTGNLNGAYIQTPGTGGPEADQEFSHGIFLYGWSHTRDLQVGDYIEAVGVLSEYQGQRQLTLRSVAVIDEEVAAVEPAVLALPASAQERERFLGMLVTPSSEDGFTVTDVYSTLQYGTLQLASGTEPLRQPTDVVRPGTAEYEALVAENAARRIVLDDGSAWNYTNFSFPNHETPVPYLTSEEPLRIGASAQFTEPVVLDYTFNDWTLQPTRQITGEDSGVPASFTGGERPAGPEDVGGDVSIAAFNVLNYFTSLGEDEAGCDFWADRHGSPTTADFCDVRGAYDEASLERQTEKIVSALLTLDADVVALQEIENSRTFVADDDRDVALATLVDELNEVAGDGVWEYVASPEDVPGATEEDVIRNAYIYQADAVTPVGESTILLDDPAFYNAREPLAQEFALLDAEGEIDAEAETFVLIVNHLKSKSAGSSQTPGNEDRGDGQGAWVADRIEQASSLADFADEILEGLDTEHVLLLGDFNSYTQEDPLQVLYDEGYWNIGDELTDKVTYAFQGHVGSLDHVIGSAATREIVTGADIWQINAFEPIAREYSRFNYNVTNFHDDSPYRSSDHDPIIVGLQLREDGGQPGEPGWTPSEDDLLPELEGLIEVPDWAWEGATIAVEVIDGEPGAEVGAWLFSEPLALGEHALDADASFEVTLPEGVTGDHRVAVYDDEGQILGWDSIEIRPLAEPTPTPVPTTPEPVPTDGWTPPGSGLPDTGAEVLTAVIIAAAVLAAGIGAFLFSRRSKKDD